MDFAHLAGRDFPRVVLHALQHGKKALRVFQEDAPGGGKLDRPLGSIDELDAELVLQSQQMLGDSWLSGVQDLGGLPEMPEFRDGHKSMDKIYVEHGGSWKHLTENNYHSLSIYINK
jgi:hypothetical protein